MLPHKRRFVVRLHLDGLLVEGCLRLRVELPIEERHRRLVLDDELLDLWLINDDDDR